MEPQDIIDSYLANVVAHLPGRLRAATAMELRPQLMELMDHAANDAGRPADRDLVIAVLRSVGRPEQVAVRLRPAGHHIIEPELAPAFLKAALACVALQWMLTLPESLSSSKALAGWAFSWGLGALWWVGVLVVWFSAATWIRGRWPADPHSFARPWTHRILWLPFLRDWNPDKCRRRAIVRTNRTRREGIFLTALAAVLAIFCIAPSWILAHLLAPGTNTTWAVYDENFRGQMLAPLLVLLTVRIGLSAIALARMQLQAPTEGLRLVLWGGFIVLLTYSLFSGNIFATEISDMIFKAWLVVFLLINLIQISAAIVRTRVH